jgi:hypothetical protein
LSIRVLQRQRRKAFKAHIFERHRNVENSTTLLTMPVPMDLRDGRVLQMSLSASWAKDYFLSHLPYLKPVLHANISKKIYMTIKIFLTKTHYLSCYLFCGFPSVKPPLGRFKKIGRLISSFLLKTIKYLNL